MKLPARVRRQTQFYEFDPDSGLGLLFKKSVRSMKKYKKAAKKTPATAAKKKAVPKPKDIENARVLRRSFNSPVGGEVAVRPAATVTTTLAVMVPCASLQPLRAALLPGLLSETNDNNESSALLVIERVHGEAPTWQIMVKGPSPNTNKISTWVDCDASASTVVEAEYQAWLQLGKNRFIDGNNIRAFTFADRRYRVEFHGIMVTRIMPFAHTARAIISRLAFNL